MKRIFISLILVMLVIGISCGRQNSDWQGTVEVVNGVTLVKNPKEPMFGPEKIRLKEILTIGCEEGDENTMFWGSLLVRTDDELNIYVCDSMAKRLSKFDARGNFLWATGRQGQGPGEFQSINDFTIDNPKQEILVLDNSQIDAFSFDGKYLRSMDIKRRAWNIDILKNGNLLILPLVPDQTGVLPLIYDSNGQYVSEFASIYSYGPSGLGPGGFSPNKSYQVFGEKIIFSLPDKYEIREYDLSGKLMRIITKDQNLNLFNIKRQNGVISSISVRDWSGPCFLWQDQYLINIIEIFSVETKIRDWSLDFFDPSGRFLCSCPLPESNKLDHIDRAGHLYFVQWLPFPKVVKYQLEINEFFP
ncbi:MAG: 6-bladed beta-propeller [Pseudomonadota bacterium]